jgi:oligopeptide transport system substrate-binding protein
MVAPPEEVVMRSLLCLLLLASAPALAQELPKDWKKALEPESDDWKKVEQTFTFNNGAEPETLDPHTMTGVPEHRLASAIFEGLVSQHPETLAPTPGAAERWEVSKDGLTYTFFLRAGLKWSNGKPLSARDFMASWERVLRPTVASQYSYMLYPIKGAEAYNKQAWPKDVAPVTAPFVPVEKLDQSKLAVKWSDVGVQVKDERTLVITLAHPCAYFLDLVAFETMMPVPLELVTEHGDRWVRAGTIVGNGPFKVEKWEPNQPMVLLKNEHYWDATFVKLTRIEVLPLVDQEVAYKLFQQGKCHWMDDVPIAKIDEVKRLPEYYVAPYLGTYFYRFNCTKKPFDDPRVRKALSISIDREQITRDLLKAGQVPATWFTPAMPGYEPPKGLPYDREAARRLLAEAGYPDGKGFPVTELLYNTLEAHKLVAENVVQQWRENLGITVSLRNSEWKVYLNDVQHLQYQLARAAWIGDYVDPNTFLDMFVTDGGNNQTGWSNKRYDELIAGAAKELDRAKRAKLLQEAEKLLIEQELPIMPVYIYVKKGLLSARVGGFHENVRDQHPLQYLWMEPAE